MGGLKQTQMLQGKLFCAFLVTAFNANAHRLLLPFHKYQLCVIFLFFFCTLILKKDFISSLDEKQLFLNCWLFGFSTFLKIFWIIFYQIKYLLYLVACKFSNTHPNFYQVFVISKKSFCYYFSISVYSLGSTLRGIIFAGIKFCG